jgi:hypothetical protein
MKRKDIYPFWELHKHGRTIIPLKIPRNLRDTDSLQSRMRKGIKIDKETGKYKVR